MMDVDYVLPTVRSVGVEEEYLLVSARTGRPVAVAEAVLSIAQSASATGPSSATPPVYACLESELKQEQIEAVSPPCTSLDDIRQELIAGRLLADSAAQTVGARAVALGTSAVPSESHVSPGPRYRAMASQFGLTMKEQLTCGLHVHVGITGEDEGVAVLDRIRPWLPVLLAISGNSPLWMGDDTGYSSYRYQALGRWPSAGAYEPFGSAVAYRRRTASLLETGVLLDENMVYSDARLCSHYPTVEIRVADVCMDVEHAVVLSALVRALVDTTASEWRAGLPAETPPTAQVRLAMWVASRFAIGGQLVHPLSGRPCSGTVAVAALLEYVREALECNGDLNTTERTLLEIVRTGPGAERQRHTLRRLRSAQAVVMEAIEVTHAASGSHRVSALA